MEARFDIDIEPVMKMFDELNGKERRNAIVAAKKAAAQVVRKAVRKSKRFTDTDGTVRGRVGGGLRRSISVKTTRKNKNVYVSAGGGPDDAYYAGWVEFGHEGPRPAPAKEYMSTAAEATDEAAIKAFADKFKQRLEKVTAKKRGR